MSAPCAETRREALEAILAALDPRVAPALRARLAGAAGASRAPAPTQTLVLAGHRAAGKSRLLPLVARLTGRPGVDLDAELERRHGRPLRTWVAEAPADFRAAERRVFESLPPGSLVAVGGGFLAHHAAVLAGAFTVLVPVCLETYRERLLADTTRPRLRPEVPLEEEIAAIFREREALHARCPTVPLEEFLRSYA